MERIRQKCRIFVLRNHKLQFTTIAEMTPILFNTRDELIKVDLDKMIYAEADGNYVYMTFRNRLRIMVTISLLQFARLIESSLNDGNKGMYIRIGRKFIIDRRYIVMISLTKQTITLSDMQTDKPVVLNAPKETLRALKKTLTEQR